MRGEDDQDDDGRDEAEKNKVEEVLGRGARNVLATKTRVSTPKYVTPVCFVLSLLHTCGHSGCVGGGATNTTPERLANARQRRSSQTNQRNVEIRQLFQVRRTTQVFTLLN